MSMTALIEVRDRLMSSGVLRSECEFSEHWLGKSECYVRGLRYSGSDPSADAWANCAAKLRYVIGCLNASDQRHHQYWALVFVELRERCYREMEAQAQRKWQSRKPEKELAG